MSIQNEDLSLPLITIFASITQNAWKNGKGQSFKFAGCLVTVVLRAMI